MDYIELFNQLKKDKRLSNATLRVEIDGDLFEMPAKARIAKSEDGAFVLIDMEGGGQVYAAGPDALKPIRSASFSKAVEAFYPAEDEEPAPEALQVPKGFIAVVKGNKVVFQRDPDYKGKRGSGEKKTRAPRGSGQPRTVKFTVGATVLHKPTGLQGEIIEKNPDRSITAKLSDGQTVTGTTLGMNKPWELVDG